MVTTRSQVYGGDNAPPSFEDIPSYTLNLDLPPRDRWKHIVVNYPNLHSMVISLVSQALDVCGAPEFTKPFVRVIMSGVLTKLANDELNEEMIGISEVTGCPVWALVFYNICYDFMAGCSSGGIKAIGESGKEEMFHYRNLDWHMEETRQTTIKVNYTRGGKSVLEAIHYAGMIGIATGVRQGLSCSLNFRARTDASTSLSTRLYQAFGMAFGHRPDTTCLLRDIMCAPSQTFDSAILILRNAQTGPSYITICSPDKVAIVQRDYASAKVTVSDRSLSVANHDDECEDWTEQEYMDWVVPQRDPLLMSSKDRKQCAIDQAHHVKTIQDIVQLTQTWPVVNDLTTFGVIMSPERGTIDWEAWYKERPVPPKGEEAWGGEFTPPS